MTISDLKKAIAFNLGKTVADLTVDGQDLGLLAMNQVRQQAEMNYDFEFSRELMTLVVNSVTGGSLSAAVVKGTVTTKEIKTVLEVGGITDQGYFYPVEWTTTAESIERQRKDNRFGGALIRHPTDAQALCDWGSGAPRYTFTNNSIFQWPISTTSTNRTLCFEAYTFSPDWTAADLNPIITVTGTLSPNATGTYLDSGAVVNALPVYIRTDGFYIISFGFGGIARWRIAALTEISNAALRTWNKDVPVDQLTGTYSPVGSATGTATIASNLPTTSDIWTTKGAQYIIWAATLWLNQQFREFVFRQEGNLPPPEKLADAALQSLIAWDTYKYEQFRRHGQ